MSPYAILFLLLTGVVLLSNALCRGAFRELLSRTDRTSFPMAWLSAPFLYLDTRLPRFGTALQNAQFAQKVGMLHGKRGLDANLRLHWAGRRAQAAGGLLVGCFFCLAGQSGWEGVATLIGTAAGFYFLYDVHLDQLLKTRRMRLRLDFPDFVSKLTLLVQAGLQIHQAIGRITEAGGGGLLTDAFRQLQTDLASGMREEEAWQHLNDRCRIPEITRFTGILLFNIRLGGSQLIRELREIAADSWEMRRQTARQLGETASSRLVLPLALMFISVLAVVAAPALMSLRTGF